MFSKAARNLPPDWFLLSALPPPTPLPLIPSLPALLAEAGYPAEKAFRHGILTTDKESSKMTAEALQAMWKEHLGATIKIKQMEWTRTSPRCSTRITISPPVLDRLHGSSDFSRYVDEGWRNNRTGWHNEEFEDILGKAAQTGDPSKRYALLAQAELLLQERPILPVYCIPATTSSIRTKGWSPPPRQPSLQVPAFGTGPATKKDSYVPLSIGRLFRVCSCSLYDYLFLYQGHAGEPFTENARPRPRPTSASSMVWTNPFGNSTSFIPRTSSRKDLSASPRAREDSGRHHRATFPTPPLVALGFAIGIGVPMAYFRRGRNIG